MKKLTNSLAIILALFVLLQAMTSISAFALDYSDAQVAKTPKDARKAVAQIVMIFVDKNGNEHPLYSETGFFIDPSYVLTTYHGLHLTDDDIAFLSNPGNGGEEWMGEYFAAHYKTDIIYRVYLNRDVNTKATLTSVYSQDYDFGVLKVQDSLNGVSVLALGNNDMIDLTLPIYSLGFPSIVSGWTQGTENTFDDVSVTQGTISKMSKIDGTDMFQNSAKISTGNSGGPTINEEGAVIGLVKAVATGDEDYAYSVYIDSIKENLDLFGIPYVTAVLDGETNGIQPVDTEAGCEHEWKTMTDKCTTITKCDLCGEIKSTDGPNHVWGEWTDNKSEGVKERVCTVCGEIEKGEAIESGFNWLLVIIIAAAILVVAIIVTIIIIIANSNKKGSAAPVVPNNYKAPDRPMVSANVGAPSAPQPPQFGPPQNEVSSFTAPSNVGGGETTVLNAGAGETTVLGASGTTCSIIRVKNGERISVNSGEFVIGKEQRRVNYCISDNTSISRVHAKIVTKGGQHYLIDLNSTNCTFVNGTKLPANTEQVLEDGDKIKLADEEFEFKA